MALVKQEAWDRLPAEQLPPGITATVNSAPCGYPHGAFSYVKEWQKMDEELKNLLEWLKTRLDDGEYATAETFLTDVFGKAGRYDEDISVRDAKIEQITGERDTALADVKNLKARNYDLLMQIPADGDNQGDGTVVENVDDDGEVTHIDNLFVDTDDDGNPIKED